MSKIDSLTEDFVSKTERINTVLKQETLKNDVSSAHFSFVVDLLKLQAVIVEILEVENAQIQISKMTGSKL